VDCGVTLVGRLLGEVKEIGHAPFRPRIESGVLDDAPEHRESGAVAVYRIERGPRSLGHGAEQVHEEIGEVVFCEGIRGGDLAEKVSIFWVSGEIVERRWF